MIEVGNATGPNTRACAQAKSNLKEASDLMSSVFGTHYVAKGENLGGIVKKEYGLTDPKEISSKTQEVCDANGIKDPNKLRIGQELKLPGKPLSQMERVIIGYSLDDVYQSCNPEQKGK